MITLYHSPTPARPASSGCSRSWRGLRTARSTGAGPTGAARAIRNPHPHARCQPSPTMARPCSESRHRAYLTDKHGGPDGSSAGRADARRISLLAGLSAGGDGASADLAAVQIKHVFGAMGWAPATRSSGAERAPGDARLFPRREFFRRGHHAGRWAPLHDDSGYGRRDGRSLKA